MVKGFRKKCKEKLMHKSDCFFRAADGLANVYDIDYDPAAKSVFHNLIVKSLFYETLANLICSKD